MNELIAVTIIRMTFFFKQSNFSFTTAAEAECGWEGPLSRAKLTWNKTPNPCCCVGLWVSARTCAYVRTYICMHEKLKHDNQADGCVFSSEHINCCKAALN